MSRNEWLTQEFGDRECRTFSSSGSPASLRVGGEPVWCYKQGGEEFSKQDFNLNSAWLVPSLNTGRKEAGEVRGASKDATSVQPRDDDGPDKGETRFESQGW